jgi:hypothetical protein
MRRRNFMSKVGKEGFKDSRMKMLGQKFILHIKIFI